MLAKKGTHSMTEDILWSDGAWTESFSVCGVWLSRHIQYVIFEKGLIIDP